MSEPTTYVLSLTTSRRTVYVARDFFSAAPSATIWTPYLDEAKRFTTLAAAERIVAERSSWGEWALKAVAR